MKRRIICILVVVLMLIALTLVGCKPKEEEIKGTPKEQSGTVFTEPGTWPIANQLVSTTAFSLSSSAGVEDINTNYVTLLFEEKTGVHVDFDVIENEEKLMIMFNSGEELPDFFMGKMLSYDTQYLLGSQGIIIPLNDWIDDYMPNTKAVMDKHQNYAQTSVRPDGNIYAISAYEECYHCTVAQKMYINKTWLDSLGLEVPTTPAEFADVLRVFKAEDANGNGDPNDELPWTGFLGNRRTRVEGFISNAWIYNDAMDRIIVLDDGTLTPCFDKDEFREALSFIAGLYGEGLIDEQMFIQDSPTIKKLTEGEFNRVGAVQSNHSGSFADTQNAKAILDFVVVPPLKGPDGHQTCGYFPPSAKTMDLLVVTKYAENPEIPLRWMDYFMTIEASKSIQYGEEGVDWMTPTDGRLGRNGLPAILDTMGKAPIFSEPLQNKSWVHSGPYYWPAVLFNGVTVLEDVYDHESALALQSHLYVDFVPDVVLPPLTYELDVAQEVARAKAQINEYVDASIAEFVTQRKDVDDDVVWQEYLDVFTDLKLETYLGHLQAAYDIVK